MHFAVLRTVPKEVLGSRGAKTILRDRAALLIRLSGNPRPYRFFKFTLPV